MSVQFNDMIITIKRNENGFVIISECKTANCNNKVTKVKTGYYSAVTFWVNSTFLPYEQLSYKDNHCPQLKHFLSTAEYQKIQT